MCAPAAGIHHVHAAGNQQEGPHLIGMSAVSAQKDLQQQQHGISASDTPCCCCYVLQVLLPHRREVELEDVRILSHHLVLQERQLGHTTITVYCLPANSSEAAQAACRYNSTAASAAEALADAKAEQKQGSSAAAAVSSTSSSSNDMAGSMGLEIESFQLQLDDDSSSDVAYEKQEVTDAPELDLTDPEQLMDSLALVESSTGSSMGDVHRQSGTFLVIRGRAGSITEAGEGSLHLTDPAVAVEEQQHMQKQQGQQQSIEQRRNQEQSKEQRGKQQQQSGKQQRRQQRRQQPQQQARQRLSDAGNKANQAAANTAAPAAQNPSSNGKSKAPPAANSKGSLNKAAAVKVPKPSSSSTASSTSSSKPDTPQPPMLSSENSWQVAFEEDAYSVSIMDTGDWSHPMLRLSYTSFTTPQSVIDIDMFTQRRVVRSVAEVGGGFRSEAYRRWVGLALSKVQIDVWCRLLAGAPHSTADARPAVGGLEATSPRSYGLRLEQCKFCQCGHCVCLASSGASAITQDCCWSAAFSALACHLQLSAVGPCL